MRHIVAINLNIRLDTDALLLAKLQVMASKGNLTGEEIVAYALPLLAMGVKKVRIAADLGISRQNLDHHLTQQKKRLGSSTAKGA